MYESELRKEREIESLKKVMKNKLVQLHFNYSKTLHKTKKGAMSVISAKKHPSQSRSPMPGIRKKVLMGRNLADKPHQFDMYYFLPPLHDFKEIAPINMK